MNSECTTNCIELRKIMAEKEIRTIKELAEKSGINRNTLALIVKGKKQPSSEIMKRLVVTLDIEPERAGLVFFSRNLRIA